MLKFSALAFAAALGLAVPAMALTVHNSVASFDAATGAPTSVPLPDVGNVGTGPYSVGPLTFDSLSGDLYLGGGFDSTLIPGNDTAISGVEDLQIDIAGGTTGFGFYLHEPTASGSGKVDSCNTSTCVDSIFSISAYLGGTLVGNTVFDPSGNAADFIGFTDGSGFDRIVIDETTGTNDNEYFGGFTLAAVPVPASLPLLLVGLGGLALYRRKRS